MRIFRRAQAALEFLMTYGWAILVVLVVVSALAYFGVLNPSNLLPEKCTFQTEFACQDVDVKTDGVQVVLQNGAGRDIMVTSMTFTSDALNSLSGVCSTGAISATVKNGQQAAFHATDPLNCAFKDTGRTKNRYSANVTYQFLDSTVSHIFTGELLARAGSGTINEGSGSYGGSGGADSSLVGYWHLDGNEGPTGYADSSGYGNTGTPMNGVTNIPGVVNGAASFDGVNQYINVGNAASLRVQSFTWAAWVYDRGASDEGLAGVTGSNNFGFKIYSTNPNSQYNFLVGDGSTFDVSVGPHLFGLTNQWVHTAIAWNAQSYSYKVYVKGALQDARTLALTGTAPNWDAFSELDIGMASGCCNYALNGAMDEVRIYNRELSAAEIAALAVP